MTNKQSPVTDVSLVGTWDPRIEGSAAEVYIYAKITPKPLSKIPIFHSQSLAKHIRLVRATRLLPDGSSSVGGAGIKALGIAIDSTRSSMPLLPFRSQVFQSSTTQSPAALREVGDALTLVDSEGVEELDILYRLDNGKAIEAGENITTTNRDNHGRYVAIPGDSVLIPTFSHLPQLGPSSSRAQTQIIYEEKNVSEIEKPTGSDAVDAGGTFRSVHEQQQNQHQVEVGNKEVEAPSMLESKNQKLEVLNLVKDTRTALIGASLPSGISEKPVKVTCAKAVGFDDGIGENGSSGNEVAYKLPGPSKVVGAGISPPPKTLDGFSTPRIISPTLNTIASPAIPPGYVRGMFRHADSCEWGKLGRPDSPFKAISTYEPRKGRIFSTSSSAKEFSQINEAIEMGFQNSDTPTLRHTSLMERVGSRVDAIEYEEGLSVTSEMQDDQSGADEALDAIKLIKEGDTMMICFPQNTGSEPVVVEVYMELMPLLPEKKPFGIFVMGGLPRCENAKVDFHVIDDEEEEWHLEVHPKLIDHDYKALAENRVRGTLDLANESATQRSFVLRFAQIPMFEELRDYKISVKTTAVFSWNQPDGQIMADFKVTLKVDADPDPYIKHSIINLVLANGPDLDEELIVVSPGGEKPDTHYGDIEPGYGIDITSGGNPRLFQIVRLTKDVNKPLFIGFRKLFGPAPRYIDIPTFILGEDAQLEREKVILTEPRLPLKMACVPCSRSWNESDDYSGTTGSRSFTKVNDAEEKSLRVYIDSLTAVGSQTTKALEKALKGDPDHFISQIMFEVEERTCGRLDAGGHPLLEMIMSFEVDVPSSIKAMEKILTMDPGDFKFGFATVNGELAKSGTFFEQEDGELMMLNNDLAGGKYRRRGHKEKLQVVVHWVSDRRLILFGGEMAELLLPQIASKIVGRVACEFQKRGARLVSRISHPSTGSSASEMINGKASLSGQRAMNCRIFLQVPKGIPGKKTKTKKARKNKPEQSDGAKKTPTPPNPPPTPTSPTVPTTTTNNTQPAPEEKAAFFPLPAEDQEDAVAAYLRGTARKAAADERTRNRQQNYKNMKKFMFGGYLIAFVFLAGMILWGTQISSLRLELRRSQVVLDESMDYLAQAIVPSCSCQVPVKASDQMGTWVGALGREEAEAEAEESWKRLVVQPKETTTPAPEPIEYIWSSTDSEWLPEATAERVWAGVLERDEASNLEALRREWEEQRDGGNNLGALRQEWDESQISAELSHMLQDEGFVEGIVSMAFAVLAALMGLYAYLQ